MSRFRLPPLSLALRRGMAVAACAAVLLTSFEDEALAAAGAGDAAEAAPRSGRTCGASLFPDLSRPQDGPGESATDDRSTTAAPPARPPRLRARFSSLLETRPVGVGGQRPLRALYCVWLL